MDNLDEFKSLRTSDTLMSDIFAGRKFRGLKKPRNFCIFAEFNFAVRGFEIIEIRDLRRFFTEKRPIQKYSRN